MGRNPAERYLGYLQLFRKKGEISWAFSHRACVLQATTTGGVGDLGKGLKKGLCSQTASLALM